MPESHNVLIGNQGVNITTKTHKTKKTKSHT